MRLQLIFLLWEAIVKGLLVSEKKKRKRNETVYRGLGREGAGESYLAAENMWG